MATGDNRAVQGAVVVEREFGPNTAKASPYARPRLAEDEARSTFYAGANQKDVLPEHTVRRDRYPFITASQ